MQQTGFFQPKGELERNHSELIPCRSFLPRKGPRQDKKVLEKLRAAQLHMAPTVAEATEVSPNPPPQLGGKFWGVLLPKGAEWGHATQLR